MVQQLSTTLRTTQAGDLGIALGAGFTIEIRTGSPPANAAAADTGTVIATLTGTMAAAAAGAQSLAGVPLSVNASAGGVMGHYRFKNGATTHAQGTVGQNVVVATNALTAANGTVLNFASTTGITVGQYIAGTGVAAGATVVAVTATTVTMSILSSAGVASAASITFSADMTVDNATVNSGQQVSITGFTYTRSAA